MRDELRSLLINMSQGLTTPVNTDLPISVLMDKLFAYAKIDSAIKSILKDGMTTKNGKIVLDYAIESNNTLLAQYLKEEGILCEFKNIEVQLLTALTTNNINKFNELFDLMLIDADINRQLQCTGSGNTLLHYALSFGQDEIVKKLIENGADVTITDWLGGSSLGHAINSNNMDCLHAVANTRKEDLFQENIYGFSPLHYAVRNYHFHNNATILNELCQRFELNKEQIIHDFKNFPKNRINQDILGNNISMYCDIDSATNMRSTSFNVSYENTSETSTAIKSGLCHGLSFLFGLHASQSREDMVNFYHALELLATWDGQEESLATPISATYMRASFHTLGDLIKQITNDAIYFYGQDSLSVTDTPPHDRKTQYNLVNPGNRQLVPLLNISMQNMQKEEFVEILKSTLKPNTILDISGAAHTVSIVCNSQNEIYYYDPNLIYPTLKPVQNLEQLATLIYHTMPVKFDFQNSHPHYLGVYHLSAQKVADIINQYPSQEEIVNKYIFDSDRKNNLYSELSLCVLQDNPETLAHLLKSNMLTALTSKQRSELVNIAINKKSLRCLNTLIQFANLDQNQIQALKENISLNNYNEILKTLEEKQSNIDQHIKFFK